MSSEVVAPDAEVNEQNNLEGAISPYVASDSAMTRCAAAVLAAGWRPPSRIIETLTELEALPNGAVVVGRMSGDLWEFTRISDDCSWWETPGREGTFEADSVDLPATVLWESGDPR